MKAVILMAGVGRRFGGDVPKHFVEVCGKPLYKHSLDLILSMDRSEFDEIVVVCNKGGIDRVRAEVADRRVKVICGGDVRQQSSYLGLSALDPSDGCVMIHDAVRPMVSKELLYAHIKALAEHNATITAIPSRDSLILSSDGCTISTYVDRNLCFQVQTPQCFRYQMITDAHRKFFGGNMCDDGELAIMAGEKVYVVEGNFSNLKVTDSGDKPLVEYLLSMK